MKIICKIIQKGILTDEYNVKNATFSFDGNSLDIYLDNNEEDFTPLDESASKFQAYLIINDNEEFSFELQQDQNWENFDIIPNDEYYALVSYLRKFNLEIKLPSKNIKTPPKIKV